MFHKLLFLMLFAGSVSAVAQVGTTPVKAVDATDYKVKGTPMPAFRMLKYVDTATSKIAAEQTTNTESVAPASNSRRHRRQRRNRDEMQPTSGSDKYMTNKDLDNGANLFVMMFNPTCSHCMDETAMLEKNMGIFKNSRLVMVANPTMWSYLPTFVKNYKILSYPQISIGIDSTDFINKIYLYSSLPQIDIYNSQRKLVKIFSGETPIDSLKAYIQ